MRDTLFYGSALIAGAGAGTLAKNGHIIAGIVFFLVIGLNAIAMDTKFRR